MPANLCRPSRDLLGSFSIKTRATVSRPSGTKTGQTAQAFVSGKRDGLVESMCDGRRGNLGTMRELMNDYAVLVRKIAAEVADSVRSTNACVGF